MARRPVTCYPARMLKNALVVSIGCSLAAGCVVSSKLLDENGDPIGTETNPLIVRVQGPLEVKGPIQIEQPIKVDGPLHVEGAVKVVGSGAIEDQELKECTTKAKSFGKNVEYVRRTQPARTPMLVCSDADCKTGCETKTAPFSMKRGKSLCASSAVKATFFARGKCP